MAACLVPDFPAVMVALEHLRELEKQLKEKGVSFNQEASHHLREISAAIKELEASRKSAHENLEIETIETSKIRHQVTNLRDDIRNEMSAGVAAVREANAEELSQLQAELNSTVQDLEAMEKKLKLLEQQNKVLIQERELVKSSHEDVTGQINRYLSKKSQKQTKLNETRNEIQTLNDEILQVDFARKQLEEDMTEERKKFDETKKTLKKEIDDTIRNIQEQKMANLRTCAELDALKSVLLNKEEKISEYKNRITQLEKSIARLMTTHMQYEEQLAEEVRKSEELDRQIEIHEKKLSEMERAFEEKVQVLQEKISKTENEIAEGQRINGIHLKCISELSDSFNIQRKEEENAVAEHQSLSRRLQRSKLRLEERIASIARHKIEIRAMGEEMKQLHETNLVNADLFQKNLNELESQLDKEKKMRDDLEVEKDRLCQSLEDLKENHERRMVEVNAAIELTKKRYRDLRGEEKKLNDHASMNSMIELLTKEVIDTEEECKQREMSLHSEIPKLATEAELISQARQAKEEELNVQQSILGEVGQQYDVEHARYQTLKQYTTELVTRRNNLRLSIEETTERTAALLKPKDDLKQELETLQTKHMEMLHSHIEEISSTEKSIYENGIMLEQVRMENSRLHFCVEQMKREICSIQKDKEKHTQETEWLKEEVHSLIRNLQEGWASDAWLTKESTERDEKILEAIHKLTEKIRDRSLHVRAINSKFDKELAGISRVFREPEGIQQAAT